MCFPKVSYNFVSLKFSVMELFLTAQALAEKDLSSSIFSIYIFCAIQEHCLARTTATSMSHHIGDSNPMHFVYNAIT